MYNTLVNELLLLSDFKIKKSQLIGIKTKVVLLLILPFRKTGKANVLVKTLQRRLRLLYNDLKFEILFFPYHNKQTMKSISRFLKVFSYDSEIQKNE
jgi:hypothetical protein